MTRLGIIAALTAASLGAAFWAGWNYGRASVRSEIADAYRQTIEEYNDADIPSDADGIRRALCVLAGRNDCGSL